MARPDPIDLARAFLALNPQEFRRFWATVQLEWNDEDSDLEAVWFYMGQTMPQREALVIRALLSAVISGQRARQQDKQQKTDTP